MIRRGIYFGFSLVQYSRNETGLLEGSQNVLPFFLVQLTSSRD